MNNAVDLVLNEQKQIQEVQIQLSVYENLHEVFQNENLLQNLLIFLVH
jgi:hypothetical protein